MPDPSSKSRPTLTVIEGREENRHMIDGFAEAAKQRGWNFCQLLGVNSDRIARLDFDGIPLDHVIFRELSRNNYHEVERLMLWLERNHKICINANVAGRRISTSDKHFQQGLFLMDPFLKKYVLPTFEAKSQANILAYVKAGRVHFPLVLKPRHGTAGKGITLVRTPEELAQVKNFSGLLIEQYVEPECDYRVFVIGGTPVGIMRKVGDKANPGDFRAWSAGRDKFLEDDPSITAVLGEIATRAAAVSRLEYAGVDIIKSASTGQFYIMETNIAAGWSNRFIPTTHIDIPALVLDWFEEMSAARTQPIAAAVKGYLGRRQKYLPAAVRQSYADILAGQPGAATPYQRFFASYYPSKYLYDAGSIFAKLYRAYQDLTEHPDIAPHEYTGLVSEIEQMPLSWAGSFIGPEVGVLQDGAILSALYLFLLHKTTEM